MKARAFTCPVSARASLLLGCYAASAASAGNGVAQASAKLNRIINQSISSCTYSPDRNPDELVWKHLRADTVGRMTITDKADFKAKVRASMCQLQNDPEKIRTKNYRSNMPPDSAFTYGLINTLSRHARADFVFVARARLGRPRILRPFRFSLSSSACGGGGPLQERWKG
jgi:hypothetical protein